MNLDLVVIMYVLNAYTQSIYGSIFQRMNATNMSLMYDQVAEPSSSPSNPGMFQPQIQRH